MIKKLNTCSASITAFLATSKISFALATFVADPNYCSRRRASVLIESIYIVIKVIGDLLKNSSDRNLHLSTLVSIYLEK